MLTTTTEMLKKAYEGKYAIPAINTQGGTYDIIRAICLAAEEMQSPVILAHYVSTGAYSGHQWFVETAKWMANQVSVPVAIHLDHGDNYDQCVQMLMYGCTSIMFDGSMLSLEENAEATNQVIQACHAVDVPVEAEIGQLARLTDEGKIMGSANITDPESVKRFLGLCHADSLAIGIGNAHGFYKEPVEIRVDILEKCRAFTDTPFVLHGCTGMDHDMIERSMKAGVAKINFGTQIRCQYVQHVKDGLAEGVDQGHAWRLSQFASDKLIGDIKDIIRLAHSEGTAS